MGKSDEALVKKNIIAYIEKLANEGIKIKSFTRQAGGFNYKNGVPDIYAVLYGFHLEIEVKGIGGTPSSAQLRFERELKDLGCLYVRPGSFNEFKKYLDSIIAVLKK